MPRADHPSQICCLLSEIEKDRYTLIEQSVFLGAENY